MHLHFQSYACWFAAVSYSTVRFLLQLQNQEALRIQLKRAEQEISVKLVEAMRRLEDPVQRQRSLVEEDRHKYLGLEECVLTQLG